MGAQVSHSFDKFSDVIANEELQMEMSIETMRVHTGVTVMVKCPISGKNTVKVKPARKLEKMWQQSNAVSCATTFSCCVCIIPVIIVCQVRHSLAS